MIEKKEVDIAESFKWLTATEKFVDESFGKVDPHYVQAVYWLTQLNPEASEELKISAYSHDIERSTHKQTLENATDKIKSRSKAFLLDQEALKKHQEKGGQIMYDYLISIGASENFAQRVRELISVHEWGGDEEQNLLKDADSLSYFEINAPIHALKTDQFTPEEIRNKFAFMYNRITSEKAKEIAKSMYEAALKLIK